MPAAACLTELVGKLRGFRPRLVAVRACPIDRVNPMVLARRLLLQVPFIVPAGRARVAAGLRGRSGAILWLAPISHEDVWLMKRMAPWQSARTGAGS